MHILFRPVVLGLLVLLCVPAPVEAQPRQVQFNRLSVANGLSNRHVTRVLQDRQGFLWFGTQDGLNRYDGYEVVVYKHDPNDAASLSHNWVMGLHEDASGALWVGTFGGGLNRFDPEAQTFTHYRHDPSDPSSLSSDFVGPLRGDTSGVLWVGTEGGGLDRFDPATGTFTHHRHDPTDPSSLRDPSNAVRALYEDRAGVLWVGTWGGGLNRFDRATGTFTAYLPDPQLPTNTVLDVVEDRRGVLWVATEHSGLNRFDRSTGAFTRVRPGGGAMIDQVGTVLEDHAGVLWAGTWGGGVIRYDPETGASTHFVPDAADPHSLSGRSVNALFEDRSGVLWVGTSENGLAAVDLQAKGFAHYRHGLGGPGGEADPNVQALYEDRSGALWVGTRDGGLHRLDRRTGAVQAFAHDRRDPHSLAHSHVQVLYEDRAGVLWVGTWGGGLNRFDRATGTFTAYTHDPRDPASLHSNTVLSLYEDAEGVLWVGTWDGLSRFDRRTGTFRRVAGPAEGPGALGHLEVRALLEDRAGNLWLGTRDGGLRRFDRATETFTSYVNDPGDATSLGSNSVWALHEDRAGRLWVGTGGGGLARFDTAAGTFARFTRRDSGLPDNVVYGIMEADDGTLWLSTGRGLAAFDPQTGQFATYATDPVSCLGTLNPGAAHRGRGGELFFGCGDGFVAFRPAQVAGNPHPPQVVLTGLRVFNETIRPGPDALLKKPVAALDEIVLTYRQNDFSLDFVGLHYADPERNRYAYMLENYDAGWRDVGTQRTATYTSLDPGTYTFRVKAANSDGVWDEAGASVRVVILPPWWQTWWFRAAAAAALLGLAFGAYSYRVRRIKAQNRMLEAQVAARTAELQLALRHLTETQDQLIHAEKMATMGQLTAGIAHEIKNPLNFVNNFAALTVELADELAEVLHANAGGSVRDVAGELDAILADLKENAARIDHHGRRADGIVRSMLLHTRATPSQRQPTDLAALLTEYVGLAYHGMKAQLPDLVVTLEQDYDDAIGRVEVIPQEIGRVVINLLNNALFAVHEQRLKRLAADDTAYRPLVRVTTRRCGDGIEIRVEDNGVGVPGDLREKIFEPFFSTRAAGIGTGLGLSLSYEIVVQGHGGALTVESEEGRGAVFTIALPQSVVAEPAGRRAEAAS